MEEQKKLNIAMLGHKRIPSREGGIEIVVEELSTRMVKKGQGGTKVFTELLKNAGLESPFGENCLRTVCEAAGNWLDNFDLSALH